MVVVMMCVYMRGCVYVSSSVGLMFFFLTKPLEIDNARGGGKKYGKRCGGGGAGQHML